MVLRLVQEIGLAFLEADRVDDGLALHALEAGFDHRPLRAVDHHRHARDLGLGGDVVQELGHAGFRIQHAFVHVDVDDVGAAADLVERHRGRAGPVLGLDEPLELLRAGDVGALADHLEVASPAGCVSGSSPDNRVSRFPAPASAVPTPRGARSFDGLRDRPDVIGRGAAAAADDVDEAALGELLDQRRCLRRLLVVLAERIRQAGVRVAADVALDRARQLREVRAHLARAERAVEADAERLGVFDRQVERVEGLARERAAAAIGERGRDHHRQRARPSLRTLRRSRRAPPWR